MVISHIKFSQNGLKEIHTSPYSYERMPSDVIKLALYKLINTLNKEEIEYLKAHLNGR